ncbi:hypothetical protein F5X99DRAFT_279294 [Biscogniauxia marginata]|nr:hypothetical protein F5X99DRAFT_279294 [Biscogniauxia marginata]
MPTGLPGVISPYTTGLPELPADSMKIQISFGYGENYNHLWEHFDAARQMFWGLPLALAYSVGIEPENVMFLEIRPYNTEQSLGFITSQAVLYFPKSHVQQLADDVTTANSALYQHPDSLVRDLTLQINPAIPIWDGAGLDGDDDNSDGNGGGTSSGGGNQDPFDSGAGAETTNAQKGATAGIAVGAAAVASAYGAAMFILARRYKRKKQKHQRTSSVPSADQMRHTGSPALMGGALLSRDFTSNPGYGGMEGNMRDSQGSGRSGMNNSARTANISAPVAAENSLGWN